MNQETEYERWKQDAGIAATAGIVAALVMGFASFAVGRVSGGEGRLLVEAIMPTSRFLCSSIMTACATILALMLTLLGMTINFKEELSHLFYHRIKQVALYDSIVLVASTCFLVIHCIPITKSDEIPFWWYSAAYYFLLAFSALLGGALITIVFTLYAAVRDLIEEFGLDKDVGLRMKYESTEDDESPIQPSEDPHEPEEPASSS